MKPVNQTVRGRLGNCFAACVASILEVPIDSLPNHFSDGEAPDRWLDLWVDFLRPYGLGIIYADEMFSRQPQGYAIAEMAVQDHPWNHAVVCLDGAVIHDPLGAGYKFERVVRWYVFTALDASRQEIAVALAHAKKLNPESETVFTDNQGTWYGARLDNHPTTDCFELSEALSRS